MNDLKQNIITENIIGAAYNVHKVGIDDGKKKVFKL